MNSRFVKTSILIIMMVIFSSNVVLADEDIDSGVYDGVNWRITSDYTLVIGKTGESQTFTYRATRHIDSYPWREYNSSITSVQFEGQVYGNGNMGFLFEGFSSITSIDFSGFNTENVTNLGQLLRNCSKLQEVDVSGFDTSNVTKMGGMFANCFKLTNLDISNFDTSKVTDMQSMFAGLPVSSLDLSGLDTSQVRLMIGMFNGCKNLSSLDVSSFDTRNVTEMHSMFRNCQSLTELDLSGFDTSQVVDMGLMFCDCKSLSYLDLSSFDVSNVTDMNWIFGECNSLNILKTPFNSKISGSFPYAMFDSYGTSYGGLPCNLSYSITLYKNNDEALQNKYKWEWGKDNYPFINSSDYFGDSKYIKNEDFLPFLAKCSNADIKRMAMWYGRDNDYNPMIYSDSGYEKHKLRNFLQNKLIGWNGSCNGMSFTAAFFKTGIRKPSEFGAGYTYYLDDVKYGQDSDLESYINIYDIVQASSWAIYNEKIGISGTEEFPELINDLYSKASLINNFQHEPIIVTLYGEDSDHDRIGHTVLCFGTEEGLWSFDNKTFNRRLLIADPNKVDTTYLYISEDSTNAFYLYDEYSEFGYIYLKLSTLNLLADTKPESQPLLISTKDNIVIVGEDGRGKLILENGKIRIEGNSSDKWVADIVSQKGDSSGTEENNGFYRLFTDSKSYTIMPNNGKELDVSLFFTDVAVDLEGNIDSAEISNDGSVVLKGAKGEVNIGLTPNDSELCFTDIEGTASGDIKASINGNSINVSGDISDYTVSNLDRKVNESSITIKGDADKTITLNKDNKLVIAEQKKTSPATTKTTAITAGYKEKTTSGTYKVLSAKNKTVELTKANNKKTVIVPNSIKIKGTMYKVVQVNAKAFIGKKIRTVTIGKNVKKIKKNAFLKSKATKMILKTKLLEKGSVKGSLKGSKIKTVQIKVGKKSQNKKYVKKYKKIFTKKNAGKKVKVK